MFTSFLYTFRATMCPSSGETTVFMWHLVFVTLYGWQSGMQGGLKYSFHAAYQTEINILRKIVHQVGFIYKITHVKYSHVQNRNKNRVFRSRWVKYAQNPDLFLPSYSDNSPFNHFLLLPLHLRTFTYEGLNALQHTKWSTAKNFKPIFLYILP